MNMRVTPSQKPGRPLVEPKINKPITRTISLKRIFDFVSYHPLTRHARIAAVYRVLRWQFLGRREIEVHLLIGNTRLAVRQGMTGTTGNISVGLHEFVDLAFLLRFLRPNDVFGGVGAKVGTYTVLAAGVCEAKTVAFEPDPGTVKHLIGNL